MAKNLYTHDFIPMDDPDDYLSPAPYDAPKGSLLNPYGKVPERIKGAVGTYNRQMDNYDEMLQKGFGNWPFETVVGRDTLTWLSKDALDMVCQSKIGKDGDYLACTYHNEPPLDGFKNEKIPNAGSHTYVLGSLPYSLWDVLGSHERDHHAVTSAKQSMAFDAIHNSLTKEDQEILMGGLKGLNEINAFMDRTNWLEKYDHDDYIVNNRLDNEPQVRKSLLDYLIEMEKLDEH